MIQGKRGEKEKKGRKGEKKERKKSIRGRFDKSAKKIHLICVHKC